MGTDIHTSLWACAGHGWTEVKPVLETMKPTMSKFEYAWSAKCGADLDWVDWVPERHYKLFSVLNGVRHVLPKKICLPHQQGRFYAQRRYVGLPDCHSLGWVTIQQIRDFSWGELYYDSQYRELVTYLAYLEWFVERADAMMWEAENQFGVTDPDKVVLAFGFDS